MCAIGNGTMAADTAMGFAGPDGGWYLYWTPGLPLWNFLVSPWIIVACVFGGLITLTLSWWFGIAYIVAWRYGPSIMNIYLLSMISEPLMSS